MARKRQIEAEAKMSREKAASHLEALAAALRHGAVHLRIGPRAVTLTVPRRVGLEIELESEGGELELEVGLSWKGRVAAKAPRMSVGTAS